MPPCTAYNTYCMTRDPAQLAWDVVKHAKQLSEEPAFWLEFYSLDKHILKYDVCIDKFDDTYQFILRMKNTVPNSFSILYSKSISAITKNDIKQAFDQYVSRSYKVLRYVITLDEELPFEMGYVYLSSAASVKSGSKSGSKHSASSSLSRTLSAQSSRKKG